MEEEEGGGGKEVEEERRRRKCGGRYSEDTVGYRGVQQGYSQGTVGTVEYSRIQSEYSRVNVGEGGGGGGGEMEVEEGRGGSPL